MIKKYLCEDFDPKWCEMVGCLVENFRVLDSLTATQHNIGGVFYIVEIGLIKPLDIYVEGKYMPQYPKASINMWAKMHSKLTEI